MPANMVWAKHYYKMATESLLNGFFVSVSLLVLTFCSVDMFD